MEGITEAIILAGGLGTRLRNTIPDLPKCMAPVASPSPALANKVKNPFLFYVINYLRSQGIERFIFSLGYKHEAIEEYLATQFATLNYECTVEEEPLGTGGALKLACKKTTTENVVVANGDTLFEIDLEALTAFHHESAADATLALKPMLQFERYGTVALNEDGSIQQFKEKQYCDAGIINGGVYILNVASFREHEWPEKFSFEKNFLESNRYRLYGQVQDVYFIDIGIPEDYNRAQTELQSAPLNLKNIDKTWTLFIDRDGVVNHEKKEDYILNWGEFVFYDGVKEAFQQLSKRFGKIIIISNQRGVGRNLMTEEDLLDIHQHMQGEIEAAGGRIDAIYYCTSTDNKHPDRKPNPGMAFKAAREIAGVDLSRAIMIGNKPSDMLFGRNAGIYTVFVKTTNPDHPLPDTDIDYSFDNLADFAKAL